MYSAAVLALKDGPVPRTSLASVASVAGVATFRASDRSSLPTLTGSRRLSSSRWTSTRCTSDR